MTKGVTNHPSSAVQPLSPPPTQHRRVNAAAAAAAPAPAQQQAARHHHHQQHSHAQARSHAEQAHELAQRQQQQSAVPLRRKTKQELQYEPSEPELQLEVPREQTCGTALVGIDQLPDWMADFANPYITKGYRLCSTYTECFLSIFYNHNCWLDTTTAIFNLLHSSLLWVWLHYYSGLDLSNEDKYVFSMFYMCCIIHTPPSFLYHWVGCAGKSLWDLMFFQRFDFLFIFLSSIPLSIALCYYTFYNIPALAYISVWGVVACVSYVAWIIRTPFSPTRRVRVTGALVFFYLMPVMYTMITHPLLGVLNSACAFWGWCVIVSLTLGAYVYGTHWPERVSPDPTWSSHSIMHVCVNTAYFSEFMFILSARRLHLTGDYALF